MARPLVVVSEELDPACLAWLRDRCDVETVAFDSDGFAPVLARAHGLIVRTYTRVDAALLGAAHMLRVVGRAGVGLDNIDVEACRLRGVEVVHTPDANTSAVTELVFAFMLDALRPRRGVDRGMNMGEWKALRAGLVGERQLRECVLGLVGFGRVGRSVARAAHGLGMRVICHDVGGEPPASARSCAEPVAPDRVFSEGDVVSIHVDNRPGNHHFVNARRLALMKPDALLINTSRGFVVDAQALASWLRANPGARAVCDVHDPEPVAPDNPLLTLPNARLTPHIGAATRLAHRNMSWVVRDVWRALTGEPPEFPSA